MDPLDEIDGALRTLVGVTSRVREAVLDQLIEDAKGAHGRAAVVEGALEYATLTRTLDGFRAQLRNASPGVVHRLK